MKTYIIKTFGCKTNQTESAVMEEKLLEKGYEKGTKENADYLIINSCAVTQEAERKLLEYIKSVKNKNAGVKVIVTGCFAQLNKDTKPDIIDKFVGIYEKPDIAELLEKEEKIVVSDINSHKKFRYEKLNFTERTRAIVKIQDGCNNRCSYCTICIARGKSRSCELKDIIEQIKTLSENCYNEVVLTGIHVGQWGLDFDEKKSLIDLFEEIEKTNIKTYRIGSLDPNEITDELITFLSKSKKFCPHFHLSLQSLCDKTLKKMNRHYNYEKIQNRVNILSEKFKNVFLGCDIIVGFPQETEEDFLQTCERLKELPLSQIHVFPYSIRPGTVAAKMNGQIEKEEKHRRMKLVKELSDKKHLKFLEKNIGETYYITPEKKPDKKTGFYKAVTPNYIKVLYKDKPKSDYCLIRLENTDKDSHSVFGKLL